MKEIEDKNIKIPDMSEVPFEDRLRILIDMKPEGVRLVVHENEEGTKVVVEKLPKEDQGWRVRRTSYGD